MTAKELFGAFVRACGLVFSFYGASMLFVGLFALIGAGAGGGGVLVSAVPYVAAGAICLVRADWIVDLAYGPKL